MYPSACDWGTKYLFMCEICSRGATWAQWMKDPPGWLRPSKKQFTTQAKPVPLNKLIISYRTPTAYRRIPLLWEGVWPPGPLLNPSQPAQTSSSGSGEIFSSAIPFDSVSHQMVLLVSGSQRICFLVLRKIIRIRIRAQILPDRIQLGNLYIGSKTPKQKNLFFSQNLKILK